jgi:hypothetical protein
MKIKPMTGLDIAQTFPPVILEMFTENSEHYSPGVPWSFVETDTGIPFYKPQTGGVNQLRTLYRSLPVEADDFLTGLLVSHWVYKDAGYADADEGGIGFDLERCCDRMAALTLALAKEYCAVTDDAETLLALEQDLL